MISYTQLSDAAQKSGQLEKYTAAEKSSFQTSIPLWNGLCVLDLKIPKEASAYDVVPIDYTLRWPAWHNRWLAISTTAFKCPPQGIQEGEQYYDLNIPGNIRVKLEYLGSVGARYDDELYIPLGADPNSPISPFPPFERQPFVRSGEIEPADILWFKFRITNTGDTILDPEGFSATFAEPYIVKLDLDANEKWRARPVNLFVRHLEYLYPGQSTELWVNFNCPEFGSRSLGLKEGDYRIEFRMICRFYDRYNCNLNTWSGTEFSRLDVPLAVRVDAAQKEVQPIQTDVCTQNRMPSYFERFEEFMSSFVVFPPQGPQMYQKGTMYLQVAPWTKNIIVRIISKDPGKISSITVPISVDDATLEIKYNPDNVMVIETKNGEEPVFLSQSMPAMRSGFQLGPYPEVHMRDFLQEQKDLGVNVIANTAGDWWIPEISGRKNVDLHSACYKYFYDVLVRQLDMKVVGWSLYPPSGEHWYAHAEALLGRKLEYVTHEHGYVVNPGSVRFVDMADPAVPEMIAAWVIYQYKRWGDTWFRTRDGRVPIDLEDSWGWMREDINGRYGVGPLTIERFRQWLGDRYVAIEKLNSGWKTNFKSFDEIDPQKSQRIENNLFVYDNPDHVFHEWNVPLEDWDCFRTTLRIEILKKTNEIIQKVIPGAEIAPRTEGANLPIFGCADCDNMHMRHLYYSQRRNAMIVDCFSDMDVVHFYSDYTTLPYSVSDWRKAMREMVTAGIIPMFLPQFNHMRDISLNSYYGGDYHLHYNLNESKKGVMIHVLQAAYPIWKITYEEGGAPGILWSDFLCDGFATETQKRELGLLSKYIKEMNTIRQGEKPKAP